MLTEKLFYENPYLRECESEVEEIVPKDDKFLLVLNKTIFYPEGGGQPSDIGEIDGAAVEYVFEKEGVIYHRVTKVPKDKKVFCKIDFERRFDHMQQHSGEHLLTGAIFNLYKGNNKGFHLGEEYVTIDIDIPLEDMTEEMLLKAEETVNSFIYKNQEIRTYVVSKEESEKLPLRKRINVDEDLRIVEAENMDCCPCCGTHVIRTGEVGVVKIIKTERYKGMTRIYFKCGNRALKDFQNKHNIITKLNRLFSSDENNLVQRVENQAADFERVSRELNKLRRILAVREVEHIVKEDSSKIYVGKYEDRSFEEIQLLGTAFEGKDRIIILGSLCDLKLLFNNNTGLDVNCGKIFKDNIKEFNGKGGGNGKKAQGTFTSKEDLVNFINFLSSYLESNTY